MQRLQGRRRRLVELEQSGQPDVFRLEPSVLGSGSHICFVTHVTGTQQTSDLVPVPLTYLIHLILVYAYFYSQNAAYWLNDLNIGVDLGFVTVVSYLAAVPLSRILESLFMAIEKLLKGK